MTIFDPLLFAGKAQLEKYQKDRMESWKKMKGTSKPNFDVYFEEIKKKWRLELPDETKPKESFANDFLETLNKNNQPKNDGLTAAGVYIPKEAVSEMSTELTKQEKEYIKCIASGCDVDTSSLTSSEVSCCIMFVSA